MSTDEIGLWAGFVLTLMVYSYLIRDNFLYRLAVYVFVGLAAGYISIITFESVITPWLETTLASGDAARVALGIMPFLLGVLLLLKTSSKLGRLGNLGIAFVIGVGAAVALVGAITGTLLPLAQLTAGESRIADDAPGLINALVVLIGVVSSLVYFQYLARRTPTDEIERGRTVKAISFVGQGFIVVTLAALYGAALITSLTIFSERVGFILTQIGG